jgi:hypothetical protein
MKNQVTSVIFTSDHYRKLPQFLYCIVNLLDQASNSEF